MCVQFPKGREGKRRGSLLCAGLLGGCSHPHLCQLFILWMRKLRFVSLKKNNTNVFVLCTHNGIIVRGLYFPFFYYESCTFPLLTVNMISVQLVIYLCWCFSHSSFLRSYCPSHLFCASVFTGLYFIFLIRFKNSSNMIRYCISSYCFDIVLYLTSWSC